MLNCSMNRPESLERLLKSLSATVWEFDTDSVQLEIHVDKDPAGGEKFMKLGRSLGRLGIQARA